MKKACLEQNKHKRFYCLLAVLLVLVFVRYAMQLAIPEPVLTIFAILIACVVDRNEIIALCMCCIPLYTSLRYYIVIGVCIVIYIVKYSREIRIDQAVIPILFFILWELLHCFNGDFSVKGFIAMTVPYLMLFLVMFRDDKEFEFAFVVKAVAVTTTAMGMILFFKVLIGHRFDFSAAFLNMQRLGTTSNGIEAGITGGEINPNTLGILCVLAISGLLQTVAAERKKLPAIVIIILLLICGLLTMSRTYLACLLLAVFLFFIGEKNIRINKLKLLLGIIAIGAAAIIVVAVAAPTILKGFISRFNVTDVTSGRLSLLASYRKYIMSNISVLLFGVGLLGYGEKIDMLAIAENIPHSGVQELVLVWGIPGLLMFIMLILVLMNRDRTKAHNRSLVNYIPLMILLAKSMVGQVITSDYTMLAFSFAYLCIRGTYNDCRLSEESSCKEMT